MPGYWPFQHLWQESEISLEVPMGTTGTKFLVKTKLFYEITHQKSFDMDQQNYENNALHTLIAH